jgi:GTP-binding protein LepA
MPFIGSAQRESLFWGKSCSDICDNYTLQLYEVVIRQPLEAAYSKRKYKSTQKKVIAKCYGGDITRKRKLWKNNEGKKYEKVGR